MKDTTIDWHKQWKEHSPYYKDGIVSIPLKNGKNLLLYPGGGFGDLSHPTTRLMLELLTPRAKGKDIIDIGTGSGILSLAALHLDASFAYAIDIEEEALLHTQKNASLNNFDNKIFVGKEIVKKEFTRPLVCINMISSEQKIAWESHPQLHTLKLEVLSSGILYEQKAAYLRLASSWGWKLLEEIREEDWLGLRFESNY